MADIVFHPSAIDDIKSSRDWYAQENKIIGERFLKSSLAIIESLAFFPYSFPLCFSNIRRAIVHGFPYHIYYQFDKSETSTRIIILAVVHMHRSPSSINQTIEIRKHNA